MSRIDPSQIKKIAYSADIVFCIDCTGSMSPIIDMVKSNAKKLPEQIVAELDSVGKHIDQLNMKVIGYRDIDEDKSDAFEIMGDFTNSPAEFKKFVDKLEARGGGRAPESTLDALFKALTESKWRTTPSQKKSRRIIIVFTDAPTLPLHKNTIGENLSIEDSVTQISEKYMNIDTQGEARLIIFGPDGVDAFKKLITTIPYAQFVEVNSGKGLGEVDLSIVLSQIRDSFTFHFPD